MTKRDAIKNPELPELFPPGHNIVATPGALVFPETFRFQCLQRHFRGDWGDLNEDDCDLNEEVLQTYEGAEKGHFLSVFNQGDKALWIITEGVGRNRVTTLLLPEDY